MKILVLGGTAFTGPHFVRELAAQGHQVRVFHRGQHRLDPLPANVKKVNADLSSLSFYRDFVRQQKYDVVVHMLAMTRLEAQEAVNTFAGHAGRVVVISSHDVYAIYGGLLGAENAAPATLPLDETAPLRTSRYLRGANDPHEKIDVEQVFLANAARLPVTILRLPPVFGPNDPQGRFFAYIKRFADRRPAVLLDQDFGNFRQTHGYVENVAHAIALATTKDHEPGQVSRIYNVGENPQARIPTMAERVNALARAANYEGRVILLPKEKCPPHLRKVARFEFDQVISDATLRRELGYAEVVGPEEGYERTVGWYRSAPLPEYEAGDFDYEAEDRVIREMGL